LENIGLSINGQPYTKGSGENFMHTISDILDDLNGGIAANNMIEDKFSYRIIYFVNENGTGKKYRVDTSYENLRQALENIIRGNLSTTNTIVLAAVTVRKNGEEVSLLGRAYAFSLDGYFQQICGEKEKEYISINNGRRRAQWY